MSKLRRFATPAGFTLVEVLIAATVLSVGMLAAARVFASSAAVNAGARGATQATMLAVEKMEQLRALSIDDPALARSPPDALEINVDRFFDEPDARFVRRWSIEPLPSHPQAAVVVQVVVKRAHAPGEARLVTIKARKAG